MSNQDRAYSAVQASLEALRLSRKGGICTEADRP